MKKGLGTSTSAILVSACERLRISAAPTGSARAIRGQVREAAPRAEIRTTPDTIPTVPAAISHESGSASRATPSAMPNSGDVAESVAAMVGPRIRVPAIPRLADSSGRKSPIRTMSGSTGAVQYQASM